MFSLVRVISHSGAPGVQLCSTLVPTRKFAAKAAQKAIKKAPPKNTTISKGVTIPKAPTHATGTTKGNEAKVNITKTSQSSLPSANKSKHTTTSSQRAKERDQLAREKAKEKERITKAKEKQLAEKQREKEKLLKTRERENASNERKKLLEIKQKKKDIDEKKKQKAKEQAESAKLKAKVKQQADNAKLKAKEKEGKEHSKKAKAKKAEALEKQKELKAKLKEQKEAHPKKPLTSYFLFASDVREDVIAKNPGIKFTEIPVEVAKRWAALNDQQKKKYEALRAKDVERYTKELKVYEAKYPPPPKRPLSPYLAFAAESIRSEKAANPSVGLSEIVKKVAEKWRSLSAEQKKPYEKQAALSKQKYDVEKKKYDEVTSANK